MIYIHVFIFQILKGQILLFQTVHHQIILD